MTDLDDIPEPDRAPGAPHPRDTEKLLGQPAAEQAFLDAYNADRLHHAWLITGPRGVGKATLAWRLARFLLTAEQDDGGLFGAPEPPTSLDSPADHPVIARMQALSEPRLYLLRRPWDTKTERLRAEITVDEVRGLKSFFGLSAADGGKRVVIVDAADEMNVNAANALLKILEEPPDNAVLLLVCHQPARLLPTILSRCRRLRCDTLTDEDIAQILDASEVTIDGPAHGLAALAAGSAGAALRMITLGGPELYAQILKLFQSNDRAAALKLADSMVGRANAERLELALELFDLFLARLARTGVQGAPKPEAVPGEADVMVRLSPHARAARLWASLQQDLSARAQHGVAVNLDPAALILDMTFKIHDTAARLKS